MTPDAVPCTGPRLLSRRAHGLFGEIVVPGDKSVSHRAVVLGAMASGHTWIEGLLESQDVLRTAAAVKAFGANVDRAANGRWRICGATWRSPRQPIDCGNSGTAVRLLLGAAAGYNLEAVFTGDRSLSARPMARVLEPLRRMGADAQGNTLPVRLTGGDLRGTRFRNPTASAQVKSAVLLAGLHAAGDVEVVEPVPSRDHTENMLEAFGCELSRAHGVVRLGSARTLRHCSIRVPGDPSSAAFPLVAGLLVDGSEVTVRSVLINPSRTGLFATLRDMGADLTINNRRTLGLEPVADITVRASNLLGVEVPAGRVPSMIDEIPILAIAAACAKGRTAMHGVAELRVKESDRLLAIIDGLRACGIAAWSAGDSLFIEGCNGVPPGGADIRSCDDHRIAMSFLVLGLLSREPVAVDGVQMIGTSFPGFAELMNSIGADFR